VLQKSLLGYGHTRFLRLGPTQDPSFLTRHLNVDRTLVIGKNFSTNKIDVFNKYKEIACTCNGLIESMSGDYAFQFGL
jgi:hypothetical protein